MQSEYIYNVYEVRFEVGCKIVPCTDLALVTGGRPARRSSLFSFFFLRKRGYQLFASHCFTKFFLSVPKAFVQALPSVPRISTMGVARWGRNKNLFEIHLSSSAQPTCASQKLQCKVASLAPWAFLVLT